MRRQQGVKKTAHYIVIPIELRICRLEIIQQPCISETVVEAHYFFTDFRVNRNGNLLGSDPVLNYLQHLGDIIFFVQDGK